MSELFNDINGAIATLATSPSQTQINLAIEANNAFVERLEQIAADDNDQSGH